MSTTGRVAQGVKLINLKDNQKVSTITLIDKEDCENNDTDDNIIDEGVSKLDDIK